MHDVRVFRAATMQEALDLVRQELGSEAVILQTRQVARRRFFPWTKPQRHVEVTAGLEAGFPRRRRAAGEKILPPSSRSARPPQAAAGRESAPLRRPPADDPPLRQALPRTAVSNDDVTFERTTTDAQVAAASASLKNVPRSQFAAAAPRQIPAAAQLRGSAFPAEFATKLDSIQKLLEQLSHGGLSQRSAEIPGELFQLYTNLIDAEVEDDIARELIGLLKGSAAPSQLQDPQAALQVLTAMVEKDISCCGPLTITPGQRKVAALVGSTGVGKTTTIAKLAANFRLRDGVKMGLVTVDTYRIAAVEQLRTYAEIIDLPMKVVTSPPEMRRALEELVGLDLILIDTAGRSPRDELQIQELKSLLGEASVDEVHLVMNLTASPKTLEATARKFAAAGTTALIMTKLDEAAGFGALLSVARKVPLPFSYLTTGQDVPDDIETANPTRMARLILGRETLQG